MQRTDFPFAGHEYDDWGWGELTRKQRVGFVSFLVLLLFGDGWFIQDYIIRAHHAEDNDQLVSSVKSFDKFPPFRVLLYVPVAVPLCSGGCVWNNGDPCGSLSFVGRTPKSFVIYGISTNVTVPFHDRDKHFLDLQFICPGLSNQTKDCLVQATDVLEERSPVRADALAGLNAFGTARLGVNAFGAVRPGAVPTFRFQMSLKGRIPAPAADKVVVRAGVADMDQRIFINELQPKYSWREALLDIVIVVNGSATLVALLFPIAPRVTQRRIFALAGSCACCSCSRRCRCCCRKKVGSGDHSINLLIDSHEV